MTISRSARWAAGTLVGLALVAVLVIALAPWAARQAIVHYLADRGVQTRMGEVDVNLFAGELTIRQAHGENAAGRGFDIGRLALKLNYARLLEQQISLANLAVTDARIDVHRNADNGVTAGGLKIISSKAKTGPHFGWGIGLEHLVLDGIRLDYSQPAFGDHPAIDHEIVFNKSGARDVETWQPNNAVPIDADITVDDSRLRLTGQITPFGQGVTGALDLTTADFALDLIAPIYQHSGLQHLTGTVDSALHITFDYHRKQPLEFGFKGDAHWSDWRLARSAGPSASGARADWQGEFDVTLLRPDDRPNTISGDSTLELKPFRVDAGDMLHSQATSARWQGKTELTLGPEGHHVHTDGTLRVDGVTAARPNAAQASAKHIEWQGQADLTQDSETREGQANGRLHTEKLRIERGGAHITADTGHFQGKAGLVVGPNSREVNADATLTLENATAHNAPGTLRSSAQQVRWQGQTGLTLKAKTASGQSDGTLHTEGFELEHDDAVTHVDAGDVKGKTTLDLSGPAPTIDHDGGLVVDGLDYNKGGEIKLSGAHGHWQGKGHASFGAHDPRLATDGSLDARGVGLGLARKFRFEGDAIHWQGQASATLNHTFAQMADGHLDAASARLEIDGAPLVVRASTLDFDGHYQRQPAPKARDPKLGVNASLKADVLHVANTAIGADWASGHHVEADKLVVDGHDRIRLDALRVHGLRLFGDTDTAAAVLGADSAAVRGFALDDLRAYRANYIDVADGEIYVRRSHDGMGVLSKFFASAEKKTSQTDGDAHSGDKARTTFVVANATLSDSNAHFTDTSVTPPAQLAGANISLEIDGLNSTDPQQNARYRLAADIAQYAHIDSRGTIAPLAPQGVNMDLRAWLRSLPLVPLSGYLNAAMGRKIGHGTADGTLELAATNGQLHGSLDTTLSNFRLANAQRKEIDVLLGISMNTAISLVRSDNDTIDFTTAIVGDITQPYFSIDNLVREAVLAGLRKAVTSVYSPLGLLNKAKNAIMSIGEALTFHAIDFQPGKHYVPPDGRDYLTEVGTAMSKKPELRLTITGHATHEDVAQISVVNSTTIDAGNRPALEKLARQRAKAVRDYLAARDIAADRLTIADPVIDTAGKASPRATLAVAGAK